MKTVKLLKRDYNINILHSYTKSIVKVTFASKMSKKTFDNKRYNTYAFKIPYELSNDIKIGDFVIAECASGLQPAVFVEFSKSFKDRNIATRYVVCKVPGYNVCNIKEDFYART